MTPAELNDAAAKLLQGLELPEGLRALVVLMQIDRAPDASPGAVTLGAASNAPRPLVAFAASVLGESLGAKFETPNAAAIADELHALVVDVGNSLEFFIPLLTEALGEPLTLRLARLIELSAERQAARAAEATQPDPLVQIREQPELGEASS